VPAEQSGISYDASELGKVLKDLERTLPGATHSALEQISIIMAGLVEDEIQTQGHGKWPPFAEATLEKRRKSESPKLLQDTGLFAETVGAAVEGEAAVAFTNVWYMVFHTSHEPRHVIPYRNPFDIPEAELLSQAEDIVLASVTAFGTR
jgi:hypothetical protein